MDYQTQTGYGRSLSEESRQFGQSGGEEMRVLEDVGTYLKRYARERPEVVAYTCFAVGFLLGWKLRPW
ncbi:MAG: hypothetical protein JNM18_13260 [Planctomycetaceae bacterium]|nr:hypothetical protein [Planctomycetaceae bacterium]